MQLHYGAEHISITDILIVTIFEIIILKTISLAQCQKVFFAVEATRLSNYKLWLIKS